MFKGNVKKEKHNYKTVRRFQEDLWGRFAFVNKSRQVLDFLYESHQNSFKHRKLLKKRFFFLVRKRTKFIYKVVTEEQELKKRRRTLNINNYLSMLKLRRFYGNLRRRNFKRIFLEKGLSSSFLGNSFAYFLESRLDVILYRSNYFKSIFLAKQFVLHKKILLNGDLETKPGKKVKVGDYIIIPDYFGLYLDLKKRLQLDQILGNYPQYMEVNYKVGVIQFFRIPKNEEVPFPFFMNLNKFSHSFFI